MTWVAAAIGGSAVLGYMSSNRAAGAMSDASAASDATQRYMYDTTRADNAPFRKTGIAANNRLAYLMGLGDGITPDTSTQNSTGQTQAPFNPQPGGGLGGFINQVVQYQQQKNAANPVATTSESTPQSYGPDFGMLARRFSASDLANDPVYQNGLQFGLDQGTQGINRQAAAGGSFLSGATLKALTKYGNDYGSTKANEAYNRFNTDNTNLYNRFAGLSGAGQQATNQVSAAGQNMANQISASQQGAGNARASGFMGGANAISGGVGQYLNYQQNQNMLNALNPYQFAVNPASGSATKAALYGNAGYG